MTGALVENTCGPGFPVLDTLDFEVEVRGENAVGYWRLRRQPIVAGSFRADDGAFEFRRNASVVAWPADVEVAGCTLEQREVIRGRVSGDAGDAGTAADDAGANDAGVVADAGPNDAGALADAGAADGGTDEPPLVGEHVIELVVTRGADCAPLLAAQGGEFDALPCRARYTLRGQPTSPF